MAENLYSLPFEDHNKNYIKAPMDYILSSKESSSMKRDSKPTVLPVPIHPPMTEDVNSKTVCCPGKAGGNFILPLGGKLIVPEGTCGKRDTIVCLVPPPNERWKMIPHFQGEHLTSEIYILTGTVNLKGNVILQMPFYALKENMLELNVKGLWKDEPHWVDVGYLKKNEQVLQYVELEIDRLGTFVVTFRPLKEMFTVTPNGCLHNARINRHINVRFPKRAVDTDINYVLQIKPISEERLLYAKNNFMHECNDLIVASEIIDIGPDVVCDFRRAATIKLPLPAGVEAEGEHADDIVVLHKQPQVGWVWVNSKYKFTRSTVTFDVKNPTRFCVVKANLERQKKMQEAVAVLESIMDKEKVEVSVFLSLKEKSWMVVIECCPLFLFAQKTDFRESAGFYTIKRMENPNKAANSKAMASRRATKDFHRLKDSDGLEVLDGMKWNIEIEGDLKFSDESEQGERNELRYFRYLKENYRRFLIEPLDEEVRELRGVIRLTPTGHAIDREMAEELALSFSVEIQVEFVAAYWKKAPVPEEVKLEKSKLKVDLPVLKTNSETKSSTAICPIKYRQPSALMIDRLSRSTRPRTKLIRPANLYGLSRRLGFTRPSLPDSDPLVRSPSFLSRVYSCMKKSPKLDCREAKVITGKSLMTLSKVVREGLTLAVHLGLPDSTITGIGFDAISSGLSMVEVSYKILLYWKRTCKDKREGAVQTLTTALVSMGLPGIAEVVLQQHKEDKELTTDCFLNAATSGISLF